jgi:hypothetical protein
VDGKDGASKYGLHKCGRDIASGKALGEPVHDHYIM